MDKPDLVPLERLESLVRQLFPMLPDNAPALDLKAVVLEAIAARKAALPDAMRARLSALISERSQWTGGPGDQGYRSKVRAEIRALEDAIAK